MAPMDPIVVEPTMTNLERALWVLEHNQYLMEHYTPFVRAAGYSRQNVAALCAEDIFHLATRIMGAVREEARANYRTVEGSFEAVDYLAALRPMSPEELLALREKINYRPIGW
jgi:hypothetical protein